MQEIKSLTVVTGQGVEQFVSSDSVRIHKGYYRANGDLFACFKVFADDVMIHEVRCVHNVSIEYKY